MGYTRSLRDAVRTAASLQRYIAYIEEAATQPPNLNSRGARGPQRNISVTPFSFDVPTGNGILVKASVRSWTALSSAVGTFADDTPATATTSRRKGFSPAKVVYFNAPNRTVSVETSNRTGLRYLKYEGETYTAPFGRGVEGDDQYDVFQQIRGDLLPDNYTGVRRVSLTVEKVRE